VTDVLTRSFDAARTGANTAETTLTPANVGANLLVKVASLHFDDDPRLEAQPLYVAGLGMSDGKVHDVLFVCTMANNVWAFDANDGSVLWKHDIGPEVRPPEPPDPHNIDLFGINIAWGILSTPVIDRDTNTLYCVCWTSPDHSVARAVHHLHAIDITSGHRRHHSLVIEATAKSQAAPGEAPAKFVSSAQKQRCSLLLTKIAGAAGELRRTVFVGFGMTHENGDETHGWLLAYDADSFQQTAAWCTSPHATGTGIWQAGQGPAADEHGDIYVMTGNYGDGDEPPKPGDLPESIVKLTYTPPAHGSNAGRLVPVAWFTPFRDVDRNPAGDDDFRDYDLGSGGPVPLPGTSLVVGAGKDGVLYVLDKDSAKFGQGSDFRVLKQQPIFFTYFPGFGIDAGNSHDLDHLYDGKTHHLHGSPLFWNSPSRGGMLFDWGENECLRAWTISPEGVTEFVAKSQEIASAGMGGKGGMPGGMLALSSNGGVPRTGVVWSLTPISGDANRHVVEGILRAYDAETLDPVPNADGTRRLKLLWDSKHIPGNSFHHAKFCPPVVADGKVFVPTYDGRVDVYALRPTRNRTAARPTNFTRVPRH
jgi:outer membrane protein assembly factor BamB